MFRKTNLFCNNSRTIGHCMHVISVLLSNIHKTCKKLRENPVFIIRKFWYIIFIHLYPKKISKSLHFKLKIVSPISDIEIIISPLWPKLGDFFMIMEYNLHNKNYMSTHKENVYLAKYRVHIFIENHFYRK